VTERAPQRRHGGAAAVAAGRSIKRDNDDPSGYAVAILPAAHLRAGLLGDAAATARPLAFVCAWPALGVAETRTTVDAALIAEAAAGHRCCGRGSQTSRSRSGLRIRPHRAAAGSPTRSGAARTRQRGKRPGSPVGPDSAPVRPTCSTSTPTGRPPDPEIKERPVHGPDRGFRAPQADVGESRTTSSSRTG
jgi:hypothetical protein